MFLSFDAKQVIKNLLEGKTPAGYSGIFNKTKIINKQELLGFFYTSTQEKLFTDKQQTGNFFRPWRRKSKSRRQKSTSLNHSPIS